MTTDETMPTGTIGAPAPPHWLRMLYRDLTQEPDTESTEAIAAAMPSTLADYGVVVTLGRSDDALFVQVRATHRDGRTLDLTESQPTTDANDTDAARVLLWTRMLGRIFDWYEGRA